MKVISVINQKGGVGKTTTAQAIAAGLTLKGHKTLLIDLDGQMNLTYTAGAIGATATILDVLTGKAKAEETIIQTTSGAIITASDRLGAIETILTETGKEYRLKEVLKPLKDRFDYCIVDCPPSLGVLTINALTASDFCIVPCQADILSLQAIKQLGRTIDAVQTYTNRDLKTLGILVTRYNNRAVLSREAVEMLEEKAAEMQTKVFSAKIRESISLKEAQAVCQNIFEYDPKSNGAKDYNAVVCEIIGEV